MNHYKFTHILKTKGFTQEEADALASAVTEGDDPAQKSDIEILRKDFDNLRIVLKKYFELTEKKLSQEITNVKIEMYQLIERQTKWYVAGIGVMATLLNLGNYLMSRH